jgi:hypothetical protein
MGLLEPQHVILLIFLGLIVVFPIWGYNVGKERTVGAIGGLFLGLFLGLIGILIIYCTNKVNQTPIYNFPGHSTFG